MTVEEFVPSESRLPCCLVIITPTDVQYLVIVVEKKSAIRKIFLGKWFKDCVGYENAIVCDGERR
jgi:hypothetical protein